MQDDEEVRIFFMARVDAYNPEKPAGTGDQIVLNCPISILNEFKKTLKNTPILGAQYQNPYTGVWEKFPSDFNQLTARHLQMLARNEQVNTNGIMDTSLYHHLLTNDQIARIRCLVKSTHVAGVIWATHMGGYRHERHAFTYPVKHILIDQAGLQWQGDFRNTGGLHFYPQRPDHPDLPEHYALWQKDMYEAMYGIKRPSSYAENHLKVLWNGVEGRLDLNSISMALAIEFNQALEAAVFQGERDLRNDERINFRFSRAGMGFFTSGLRGNISRIRVARLEGIAMVLEGILKLSPSAQKQKLGKIGRIVLPHSNETPYSDEIITRIGCYVRNLGLEWGGVPEEDSFTPVTGYVNAITNCADPHAMPGNEGGPSSVDACIAYNANINHHNAAYNQAMQIRISPRFVFSSDAQKISRRSVNGLFSTGYEMKTDESDLVLDVQVFKR